MIDEFRDVSKNGMQKNRLALTEPILIPIIRNVRMLGELYDEKVSIIVDELKGYGDIFTEISDVCKNLGWMSKDSTINQSDSKNEIMIQMADLLSGYIERSFKNKEDYMKDTNSNKFWMELIGLRDFFVSKRKIIPWEIYGDDKFVSNISDLAGLVHNK